MSRIQGSASQETSLEGTVDRVIFANEESGWSVLRLEIRGREPVTAVGNLLGVQLGENLRLTGEWVRDRKYGQQFRVATYLTVKPATFQGIEKYLSSGMIAGIGPEMARRLVQHFGLATLDVIDDQPERLHEVEGIGPVRSERIRQAWRRQREIRQVMVFLQSHGVSSTYASRIYKRYGDHAVAWVRENPFRLAQEIPGIGFRSADRIAQDLGIPPESPHRAAAGILHALNQASDLGHVYLPAHKLIENTAELLEVAASIVAENLERLCKAEELRRIDYEGGREAAIFLPPLELAEATVAKRLLLLTRQRQLPFQIRVDNAIEWFESQEEIELAPQQRQALEVALTSKVLILTGGPGTGKTTLVRGMVRILERKGLRVQLAAPTGRAAKRLMEATGHEAKTLHRLLELQPIDRTFARGPDNPLELDLLVVDEASMLDTVLACNLLQALPPASRLILVGDIDQLPSVGPGRLLEDLIASQAFTVVRLTEIFRQASQSLIVVNAHRVRDGQLPIHGGEDEKSDFFWIEREAPEAALQTIKHLVAERIPRRFGFDPMTAIQLLTPMRRGLLGIANLNAELQAMLNPDGETVARGGRLLRVGDRVMQIRNNYELEVFNGDIGKIASLSAEERTLEVDYEGRLVCYEFDNLDELALAYACSIHKSQGSEYPCVVIALHTQHYALLQRNLLYTALTRGRRLVVIVGNRRGLEIASRNTSGNRRHTLLVERLRAHGLER